MLWKLCQVFPLSLIQKLKKIILENRTMYETHLKKYIKNRLRGSGQDGGVGRNPSLPRTTKRRIKTNLKSINNQKCQKIKLHGTPITTALKKQSTRTTRLVRHWMERNCGEVADCVGGGDLTGNWDSEVAVDYGGCQGGGNSQPQREFIEKCARDKQASCIVPSLAPPPQAVLPRSKESCPAQVNT